MFEDTFFMQASQELAAYQTPAAVFNENTPAEWKAFLLTSVEKQSIIWLHVGHKNPLGFTGKMQVISFQYETC